MAGYVILYKFTERGLARIKEIPERIKRAKELSQKMGIRVIGVWVTMGEYDMISIVDAPNDQTLAARVLATAMAGNVTTQTMRALSEDEFAQVVNQIPEPPKD